MSKLKILKHLIKKIFNFFGFEVHRLILESDPTVLLIKSMEKVNTNILLDVGANTGQFSMDLRQKGFKGKIISFEPLSSAWKQLIKNASKDKNWIVHDRIAIGDFSGTIDINISKNSVSSSILPMLDTHLNAAHQSKYVSIEKTKISTLDNIINIYLNDNSNCFLKIDTQGYEWMVLDGASNLLKKTGGILCELSLIPLYKGQHLWEDIILRLKKENFKLWSIQKGFTDKKNGRTLQINAVFLKEDRSNF